MISEYIQAALSTARYELIRAKEPFYGEIRALRGVWATGRSLEACRANLIDTLEGWVLVRLKKGLRVPPVNGRSIQHGFDRDSGQWDNRTHG